MGRMNSKRADADRRGRTVSLAALLLLTLLPSAQAQPAPGDDWLTRTTLTGDWNGARSALAAKGVRLDATWIADVMGNVAGGMRQGLGGDGELAITATLDLDTLVGWQGTQLVASLYWLQGNGLSADYVGNLLTVTNIELQPELRLGDLYLEHDSADGVWSLRLGQIGIDDDFAISPTAGLFVNSTFGWPGLGAIDLPAGGPAEPLPTPGARLRWTPNASWSVQGAVFNGNPDGDTGNTDGLDFPLDNGVLAIAEITYTHTPKDGLTGLYRFGGWYLSEGSTSLTTASNGLPLSAPGADAPLPLPGSYALYAIADQPLLKKGDATLAGFLRLAVAPQIDRNEASFYVDAGLTLTGPLPGRPNDVAGLAFAYAKISPDLADADRVRNAETGIDGPVMDYEAVLEVTYLAAVTPWLSVQPFFQYIIHPGGNVPQPDGTAPTEPLRNATVIGVRTSVVF